MLEISGASAAIENALGIPSPWGKLCLVGLGGEVRFPVLWIHRLQVDIRPSISMSIAQQRQCAEFVVANDLDVDGLFSHRWPLENAVLAYEVFDRQDVMKGVFVFDG